MNRIALAFSLCLILCGPASAQNDEANPPGDATSPEQAPVLAWFKGEALTARDLEPDARTLEITRKTYSEKDFQMWLEGAHGQKLTGLIFGGLLDEYRRSEEIEATPEEIDQFIEFSDRAERESNAQFRERLQELETTLRGDGLSAEERARLEAEQEMLRGIVESRTEHEAFVKEQFGEGYEAQMRQSSERIARQMIVAWKTNRSLFDRYGGRVIFQQAGPEPVDAYRRFLEEHRDAGDFEIVDPELQEAFWHYFVNDRMHTFYDAEEGASWMQTPWWMRDVPIE